MIKLARATKAWMAATVFTAAVLALICFTATLGAQANPKLASISKPPMGWSSWNSFSNIVDSQVIVNQAKAMIASGMKKAGYEYVNIDEGWWLGQRDAQGNIVVEPTRWPALEKGEQDGDMSNIVLRSLAWPQGRHLHRRGARRVRHVF